MRMRTDDVVDFGRCVPSCGECCADSFKSGSMCVGTKVGGPAAGVDGGVCVGTDYCDGRC